jgi:hypothetical protein
VAAGSDGGVCGGDSAEETFRAGWRIGLAFAVKISWG